VNYFKTLFFIFCLSSTLSLTLSNKVFATSVALANKSSNNIDVLVFGDSLSAAYNIPTDKGWVHLLQQSLNEKKINSLVSNASISGETSSGGLVRFQSQIDKSKPGIVILELGANDGLRGANLQTTQSNLVAMINMSHEIGADVILAGILIPPNYGRTYTRKFSQIYSDLALLEKVSLIPFILEGVATHQDLMLDDGLHPNEEGQKIIVQTVLKHLLPVIESRKIQTEIKSKLE